MSFQELTEKILIRHQETLLFLSISNTVKPVYSDRPRAQKFVAVVGMWSLFRGSFML
jgi:hypothetical protein